MQELTFSEIDQVQGGWVRAIVVAILIEVLKDMASRVGEGLPEGSPGMGDIQAP